MVLKEWLLKLANALDNAPLNNRDTIYMTKELAEKISEAAKQYAKE